MRVILHKFSMHTTSILGIEYERVRCFVRGLILPIQITTQSLVSIGRSLSEILNHARVMEEIHCKGPKDRCKRPTFQIRFSGSL